ncbi:GH25 family lysozyme [Clostridium sp. AWRP]|uniref:GH25 family lysozyme n=1 Tax=Clostridium sp. AWRP TaxID=2212991 RepID=UPI000FDA5E86|nr:GH25 family lysozyme [Clostridium sp. AWRP]AZV56812.1 glycosyl hydrolase [Clostridium sp. AWRP]
MKGIDIFSGNNIQSFQQIKSSGVEVVYIKATEGRTYTDKTFYDFYKQAKALGLKVGFYHYLRGNDPVIEAQHFLSVVSNMPVDCVYAIDTEDDSIRNSSANQRVRQFADHLKSRGKAAGLYTYDSFYEECLNKNIIGDLPLWVAHYGVSEPNVKPYAGFQYSETGRVPGISGNVDLNIFNDGILLDTTIVPRTPVLKEQIQALEYWLNVDYNAHILDDGLIRHHELDPNLEAVGKIITKGHKSHLVQWIQQKLEGYGYLKKGSYIDMLYDEPTFQAVTNMQKNWQRETSGKILVSNRTWEIFLNN